MTDIFCKKCGTRNTADSQYCKKCGVKLELLAKIKNTYLKIKETKAKIDEIKMPFDEIKAFIDLFTSTSIFGLATAAKKLVDIEAKREFKRMDETTDPQALKGADFVRRALHLPMETPAHEVAIRLAQESLSMGYNEYQMMDFLIEKILNEPYDPSLGKYPAKYQGFIQKGKEMFPHWEPPDPQKSKNFATMCCILIVIIFIVIGIISGLFY